MYRSRRHDSEGVSCCVSAAERGARRSLAGESERASVQNLCLERDMMRGLQRESTRVGAIECVCDGDLVFQDLWCQWSHADAQRRVTAPGRACHLLSLAMRSLDCG